MGFLASFARRRRSQRLVGTLPAWGAGPQRGHVVQFYDGPFPVDTVVGFVQAGIDAGEVAIVIATREHVLALDARLQGRGRCLYLDADETLAKFMVDGRPDRLRFRDTVGDVVQQAAEHGDGRVRAFGEMVVLLCERGQPEAAHELELLWNEVAREHDLRLLCSYPMSVVAQAPEMEALRDSHSHHVA